MEENKILFLEKINKNIWKNHILKDISLDVNYWEIYWFLWPNWAWKTTTMKIIMGLLNLDSWKISILWKESLDNKTKAQIWFMPENTYLYKHLTWREFLEFNANFFDLNTQEIQDKILYLSKKVWLENALEKPLSTYSKWMLQRIWLAQSVIWNPKIVFLDEPMSWLDPIWRKIIKNIILELKSQGISVFLNTHILADAQEMCDRISIINEWKIIVSWKKICDIEGNLEDFFIDCIDKSN